MNRQKFVRWSLLMGVAIPILYFGIQIVAVPFYPEYSFLLNDASDLGSEASSFPALFNLGTLVTAFVALLVAGGFFAALRRHGVRWSVWGVVVGMLCLAVSVFNAFLFPLPDPRHTSGVLAAVGMGMILLPIALPLSVWKLIRSQSLKTYFVGNFLLMIVIALVVSGMVQRTSAWTGVEIPGLQYFLNNYSGLLQRLMAVVFFVPIAVSSVVLLRANSEKEPLQSEVGHSKSESRQLE